MALTHDTRWTVPRWGPAVALAATVAASAAAGLGAATAGAPGAALLVAWVAAAGAAFCASLALRDSERALPLIMAGSAELTLLGAAFALAADGLALSPESAYPVTAAAGAGFALMLLGLAPFLPAIAEDYRRSDWWYTFPRGSSPLRGRAGPPSQARLFTGAWAADRAVVAL